MLSDAEAGELNILTARAMGWELRTPHDPRYPEPYWIAPGSGVGDVNLPDFARDPHALGWMTAWLGKEKLVWAVDQQADGESRAFVRLWWTAPFGSPGEALARAIVHQAEAKTQDEKEAQDGH